MMVFEAIQVAIVAHVFFQYLFAPGHILGFWGAFVDRLASEGKEWLAKPLGHCGICFSGQVGFWWYLIAYRDEWILGDHLIFFTQVIFWFAIIKHYVRT